MESNQENDNSKNNLTKSDKKENPGSSIISLTLIKSIYRMKQIFSFLSDKRKLYLIIYNKFIQNKIGINIDSFKDISGKYRIIDKDGKGKEYNLDTNKLIFEGEYINNKKNGFGKEYYYNGNIKFEGEYLNGKIISGIEYDYTNYIILKIDKDGNGEEYYYNKNIKFKGEYLNGKKWNGKGYNKKGMEKVIIKKETKNMK